ncbi:hypothetical protein N665_0294s0026 [Sinapis alba]|nr:hypothetical protein N665_0294s0026 [Sinapis alba]
MEAPSSGGWSELPVDILRYFAWDHFTSKDLRGLLWVDDNKNGDYVVVWRVDNCQYLGFCKKGDAHYREITLRTDVLRELRGVEDMVLKGYNLYLLSSLQYNTSDTWICLGKMVRMNAYKPISVGRNIVVTTSGEVLFLYTRAYEPASGKPRIFRLYKRDAKDLDPGTLMGPPLNILLDTWLVEVDSLGDEALFFDLGTTVPADHALGIEPNSIYFTRNDPPFLSYGTLSSNFKLNDAMWFLPS